MLAKVIRSKPSLLETSTLLSKEDIERTLAELAPFFLHKVDCPYHLYSQFDATNAERDQVINWFRSLKIAASQVDVYWVAQREAVRLPLDLLISYFDDLWFPSSHDVVVMGEDGDFLIELNHEEKFSFWKR